MLTTIELLNLLQIEAQKQGANPTDYAVAKLLKITQATVSRWRCNVGAMSDKTGVKAAEVLDIPAGYIVACLTAERHQKDELFTLYCDMAYRLSPANQNYHHAPQ